MPMLLEQLDLTGTIITIDAMGTQTQIARQIRECEADYILALKANHGNLYQTAQKWFQHWQQQSTHAQMGLEQFAGVEKGHHRIETRQVWVFSASEVFSEELRSPWLGLQSLVVVRTQRHLWNQTTCETRFFLSSIDTDAPSFARFIRSHWEIENATHWCLDVVFALGCLSYS
jgi:predicted transposase YbfD/YdcC